MPLLIGIDLGTTGCRAVVYDDQGTCLGDSYREYGLITHSASVIEQDAAMWWELACGVVREAIARSDVDRNAVRALAVSSQGIAFVLIDEIGRPLGNAISWLDTRAGDESVLILERYPADRLFAITGKRASPAYVLPKLLWLRRNRPDEWRRARRILLSHDYLVYRACGECVTDHSLAGGTLLYDLRSSGWSDELLAAFDIAPGLLPTLRWAGTPVGTLTRLAAEELGLPPATIVVVGGQDQKCAALGAGIESGVATVSLGTAAAIIQTMDRPHTDIRMRVPTFSFVLSDCWVLEGVIGTGAGSLRWLRDLLGGDAAYDGLVDAAAGVTPGTDGLVFLPHLSGAGSPYWDGTARATFHGLSLATTRAHLTRAVLEGVAFQIRANLAVTQELAGVVKQVILFGGGARSSLWRAIIGDAANLPVATTPSVETAALGAAMLAGLGSGLFVSPTDARRALVQVGQSRAPVAENVAFYETTYHHYREIEERLLCR
jgi:xylulokinase